MSDAIQSRLETIRKMAQMIRDVGSHPVEMVVHPNFYRDLCAEMGCEVGTLTEVDGILITVTKLCPEGTQYVGPAGLASSVH